MGSNQLNQGHNLNFLTINLKKGEKTLKWQSTLSISVNSKPLLF